MASMTALTQHLKATHDPAALLEYEAAKRHAAREAAMLAYLEAAASPHYPLPSGGQCRALLVGSVNVCNCRRRHVIERARAAYAEAHDAL